MGNERYVFCRDRTKPDRPSDLLTANHFDQARVDPGTYFVGKTIRDVKLAFVGKSYGYGRAPSDVRALGYSDY